MHNANEIGLKSATDAFSAVNPRNFRAYMYLLEILHYIDIRIMVIVNIFIAFQLGMRTELTFVELWFLVIFVNIVFLSHMTDFARDYTVFN